ncbi:galactokinase [Agaribacter flavus]|uniref:Galactokinase n=1 Tax=Agaribacter flavus TaxID=1902781 RepID=A0ABV7FPG9_9ALTE
MSLDTLKQHFEEKFSHTPDIYVSSPGRVNLIGEHTDYNNGFVLPCALQYKTHILATKRDDSLVKAYSLQYLDQPEEFDLNAEIAHGQWAWGDYLRGVAKELLSQGHQLSGLNIFIDSQVPQGSGLSSSAALEVAAGGLFNHVDSLGLSTQQIARTGQLAENNFIDCQCGIMDQLISAEAQEQAALLIDCRDLSTRTVSIPDNLTLLVINSNYPRKLAESEYNERRTACELAASTMGTPSLREANMDMLEKVREELGDVVYRRAKHIITENQRVLDAEQALSSADLPKLYEIMKEAHLALKHDFEITVPATDGLVDICMEALEGNGACRQTGGGFGGAVICLCDKADVDKVITAVEAKYEAQFNLKADILICEPGAGLQATAL